MRALRLRLASGAARRLFVVSKGQLRFAGWGEYGIALLAGADSGLGLGSMSGKRF